MLILAPLYMLIPQRKVWPFDVRMLMNNVKQNELKQRK